MSEVEGRTPSPEKRPYLPWLWTPVIVVTTSVGTAVPLIWTHNVRDLALLTISTTGVLLGFSAGWDARGKRDAAKYGVPR